MVAEDTIEKTGVRKKTSIDGNKYIGGLLLQNKRAGFIPPFFYTDLKIRYNILKALFAMNFVDVVL